MVRRFLSFISRSVDGLHEAAYLIAFFTLLSQLLGLFRDRLLAGLFGAGTTLDVYYASFRIPDFIFASIASIVSMFVLIPFLSDKIARDRADVRRFLSSIATAFSVVVIIAAGIVWWFVPTLSEWLYPGFSGESLETLIVLTRVLLVSPILLGLSNIIGSVTQVNHRFLVYSLSPILYNLGIILGIVWLYPVFGIVGIAYGVVIGAVAHLLIQVPSVIADDMLPLPTLSVRVREIWDIVRVSIPRTATLALNQAAILALVGIASTLPSGSITIFNLALNLQSAPLAIIGVSYSVAAFPTLSRLFSNGNTDEFIDHLLAALRHILFWSFPVIVFLTVLRAHIVRVLLGSGAFDWSDTRLTAAALALFVISLVANNAMLLFVRGYYAAGKTARPLLVNVVSAAVIVLSTYGLITIFQSSDFFRYFIEALFRVEDVSGSVILMLPMGYSIGVLVNAAAFWILFRRDFGGRMPQELYVTLWQSFSASVIGGAATYLLLQLSVGLFDLSTTGGVFAHALMSGLAGIAVFAGVLYLLESAELREIWNAVHSRFWKARPIGPEASEL